jgi:small subunit ribosomal protein S16
MAVRIRLTRMGKKRQPSYRVVVVDSRKPRDGRYIEQIGRYDPRPDPSLVEIDTDRASFWLERGARPSSQVTKLLEIVGTLPARPVKPKKEKKPKEVAEAVPAVEETAEDAPPESESAPEETTGVAEEPVAEAANQEGTDPEPTAEAESVADGSDEEDPEATT